MYSGEDDMGIYRLSEREAASLKAFLWSRGVGLVNCSTSQSEYASVADYVKGRSYPWVDDPLHI